MPFDRFNPPGMLEDLLPEHRPAWNTWMSARFDRAAAGHPAENDGPRTQFFNPTQHPPSADAVEQDIRWAAFPRQIQIDAVSDQQRWKAADASRDNQDEYCEWSVERNASGKITRVTFTCEGPEYWVLLATRQPDTVLALYQQHVHPSVKHSDLFTATGYNPRNKWNNSTTRGAIHLIQTANTLGAEIELAAGASIVRRRDGVVLTSAQELIQCSAYGAPERHSDPRIGADVNALARQGADVTLADPVGIYFDGLVTPNWVTPDGSDARTFWKVTRGTEAKALRAVYEVPASKGFVVGDIRIKSKPIAFGAQIADFITMKLTGLATRFDVAKVRPVNGCRGGAGLAAADDLDATIAAALGAETRR